MSELSEPTIKRRLEKIDEYSRYYGLTATCDNCFERNSAYIKKGERKDGYSVECDNCGCIVSLKNAS